MERMHRINQPYLCVSSSFKTFGQVTGLPAKSAIYAFMRTPRNIGGLSAGLSVYQVQIPHPLSVPDIGVRVQADGVSGAVVLQRRAVGNSSPVSVYRVQRLSVKQVRAVRCIECRSSVFRMQADSFEACRSKAERASCAA